jgi:hypothetical protein
MRFYLGIAGYTLILILLSFTCRAQKLSYTNHTEVGVLIPEEASASFTFQTFNGIKIPKSTLDVGITTGLDIYPEVKVIPLALGLRIDLLKTDPLSFYAGLDAGLGFGVLRKSSDDETSKAGTLINPAIGLKFKTQSKQSITVGFGFRSQELTITKTRGTSGLGIDDRIGAFNYIETNKYKYRRLSLRLGVSF